MFRLLGFLIGSAVSIGAILLFLGVPEFHLSNPQLDKGRFDEALEKLREKKIDVAIVARESAEQLSAAIEELAESPAGSTELPTQPDPLTSPVAADDPPIAIDPTEFAPPGTIAPVEQDIHWHAFWNPFRSKIAADGFVSQLEKVTGLDYRVVKVKAGVYEVAFAYDDDGERQARLSQISAATGLELPAL